MLNAEQQNLVEDFFDHERQKNPALEAYFGDGVLEPVFVKNLEMVQGDERDLILLGIGYAYGPAKGLPDSKIGTFSPALYDEVAKQGWAVISLKNDWDRIFSFEG